MADARVLCPHCGELLSKKSYCAHKRLYYDTDEGCWIKKRRLTADDHHMLIFETEDAIEQFEFDARPEADEVMSGNEDRGESPPPLFDYDENECSYTGKLQVYSYSYHCYSS